MIVGVQNGSIKYWFLEREVARKQSGLKMTLMVSSPEKALIYHITDVENLPGILANGGLFSDAEMQHKRFTSIGYGNIKQRRLQEIKVECREGKFVGEFVPFYFCPRSPMLYTVNRGLTGRPVGCQRSIVHLVSTVAVGIELGKEWAISDGNAGAFHTQFYSDLDAILTLDWPAIRAIQWQDKAHQKSAEFLVADFFPWTGFHAVGCYNDAVVQRMQDMLRDQDHRPIVEVKRAWYY